MLHHSPHASCLIPHAPCPRPGSRPELRRSQKTAAANICSFVIQDCCAVDIHWGPERQLKLQVVVAHCAIKAKTAGKKKAATAAAIEENPSLISPKVAAGSKNKGQNGQPEGERHKADAARTANVQHVVAAAGCKQAMQQARQAKSQTALGHLRQRN